MRIVSMVPSWTEMLIECGVDVVGRTRFCIHPTHKVKSIQVVGGTKNIEWQKVSELKPDLILLDKEENPKSMKDESNFPAHITHVTSVNDLPGELSRLAQILSNEKIGELGNRWENVIAQLRNLSKISIEQKSESEFKKLGFIDWIKKPKGKIDSTVYVIWKNPYMAVAKETFVGSMLELVGLGTKISQASHHKLYPEIFLEEFDHSSTLFLFSSEPFPFHKKTDELKALNVNGAIVDGECFSWFGLRSLKFLENQTK